MLDWGGGWYGGGFQWGGTTDLMSIKWAVSSGLRKSSM